MCLCHVGGGARWRERERGWSQSPQEGRADRENTTLLRQKGETCCLAPSPCLQKPEPFSCAVPSLKEKHSRLCLGLGLTRSLFSHTQCERKSVFYTCATLGGLCEVNHMNEAQEQWKWSNGSNQWWWKVIAWDRAAQAFTSKGLRCHQTVINSK